MEEESGFLASTSAVVVGGSSSSGLVVARRGAGGGAGAGAGRGCPCVGQCYEHRRAGDMTPGDGGGKSGRGRRGRCVVCCMVILYVLNLGGHVSRIALPLPLQQNQSCPPFNLHALSLSPCTRYAGNLEAAHAKSKDSGRHDYICPHISIISIFADIPTFPPIISGTRQGHAHWSRV